MKIEVLRYWSILDLGVLRPWLTDVCIRGAQRIDNKDGTYGIAFDLQSVPPECFVAISDNMRRAIDGERYEPLSTAPPRVLRKAPCLQELVRRFGGYHLIPPQAWAEHDRTVDEYRALMRNGELEI